MKHHQDVFEVYRSLFANPSLPLRSKLPRPREATGAGDWAVKSWISEAIDPISASWNAGLIDD